MPLADAFVRSDDPQVCRASLEAIESCFKVARRTLGGPALPDPVYFPRRLECPQPRHGFGLVESGRPSDVAGRVWAGGQFAQRPLESILAPWRRWTMGSRRPRRASGRLGGLGRLGRHWGQPWSAARAGDERLAAFRAEHL
jgi:hypothetical protein